MNIFLFNLWCDKKNSKWRRGEVREEVANRLVQSKLKFFEKQRGKWDIK